jgi:toxin ParE1/3/4
MAKYFLTNKAVDDLSMIWQYTYEALSETQADKYYTLLTRSFQEIAMNPGLGRAYTEIDNSIVGYPVGKHIVFYHTIASDTIEVIRILHQRMDLKTRIQE